jgi:hypothetical protein
MERSKQAWHQERNLASLRSFSRGRYIAGCWALFLLLPIVLMVGAYFYFEGNARRLTQKRLALVGEESVSVGRPWQRPRDQPGEPTHAHLHHRQ